MKSVERRFRLFQKAFPSHSSFIVFGRTIQGQKLTHRSVGIYFHKLVDKSDYDGNGRQLLKHFYGLLEKSPMQEPTFMATEMGVYFDSETLEMA